MRRDECICHFLPLLFFHFDSSSSARSRRRTSRSRRRYRIVITYGVQCYCMIPVSQTMHRYFVKIRPPQPNLPAFTCFAQSSQEQPTGPHLRLPHARKPSTSHCAKDSPLPCAACYSGLAIARRPVPLRSVLRVQTDVFQILHAREPPRVLNRTEILFLKRYACMR